MASNGSSRPADATEAFIELVKKFGEKYNLDPEAVEAVVRKLIENKRDEGLSDEDLEKLTGYRQGVIRRILRMLHDELKIATYRRGRHPETKATRYFWSLDADRINVMLYNLKRLVLSKLRARLEYETSTDFYICPRCGVRYTFDEAFEYEFTCPRCGAPLEEDDKTPLITTLKAVISNLEEEIERDARQIFRGQGG